MKKLITIPLLTFLIALTLAVAACDKPSLPPDPYGRTGGGGLPEQSFTTAESAYAFAKKYFEETVKSFETTYYGIVTPSNKLAPTQINYSRRYLSSNGDFLYDSANQSKKMLNLDPSFSFVAAQKGSESGMYYSKFDGDDRITIAKDIPYSDFSDLTLSDLTACTKQEFIDTCGLTPRSMVNYKIDSSTIVEYKWFKQANNGDFTFRLVLNSGAHESYRRQVEFNSGYKYSNFTSLYLDFTIDKFGRPIKIGTNEVYSVVALGTEQKSKVVGEQHFSYSNPQVNFNGFTVSYNDAI